MATQKYSIKELKELTSDEEQLFSAIEKDEDLLSLRK